jgi:hypothetical protein
VIDQSRKKPRFSAFRAASVRLLTPPFLDATCVLTVPSARGRIRNSAPTGAMMTYRFCGLTRSIHWDARPR